MPPPDRFLEHHNANGPAPVLVLCDHAGRRLPEELPSLGIGAEELARHIGWDIGAADLARRLATRLEAPAILNHVSRLVIDANRRPGLPSSIPACADGCLIPANQALDADEVRRRVRHHWRPYHQAVARRLGRFRRRGVTPAVVAIHSFTPRLDDEDRPWHVGVLWRGDKRLAAPALAALGARGDLLIGDNAPYSGLAEFGYTIEFHCQRTRLPHIMFEVRQDVIATRAAAERYADILASALRAPLAEPSLYRPWEHRADPIAWRRYGFAARA